MSLSYLFPAYVCNEDVLNKWFCGAEGLSPHTSALSPAQQLLAILPSPPIQSCCVNPARPTLFYSVSTPTLPPTSMLIPHLPHVTLALPPTPFSPSAHLPAHQSHPTQDFFVSLVSSPLSSPSPSPTSSLAVTRSLSLRSRLGLHGCKWRDTRAFCSEEGSLYEERGPAERNGRSSWRAAPIAQLTLQKMTSKARP